MAAPARKTNWFAIWVTIGVVVALVVVGVVVLTMNKAAVTPSDPPKSANIDTETGAIVIGAGAAWIGTIAGG